MSSRRIDNAALRRRGLHTCRDNLGEDQTLDVSGKTLFAMFREELLDRFTTRAAVAAESEQGGTGHVEPGSDR
ncbi:hypothetical protein H0Z60_10110 [Ectothiorhodospiraceae bacterium WFHF3C12]|nr:hypothetical protein [Ectothiorhodospiraceae bacterium WFHF3C12]